MMSVLHLLLLAGPSLTAGQSDQVSNTSYQQQFQGNRFVAKAEPRLFFCSNETSVEDCVGKMFSPKSLFFCLVIWTNLAILFMFITDTTIPNSCCSSSLANSVGNDSAQ